MTTIATDRRCADRSFARPAIPFQADARRIAWREGPVAALRGSLASYAGHLQHGASGRAWQRVWTHSAWLGACFRRQGWWRFAPRWPTAPVMALLSFGVRYRRLVSAPGDRALVFWRVGRYVEFRGPGLAVAVSVLGLRRVVLPRGGYRYAAGFP